MLMSDAQNAAPVENDVEPVAPEPAFVPGNSAMTALWSIAAVGGLLGIILLIVGGVTNANTNPYSSIYSDADPLPGLGAMIWGGAFLNIGILGAIGGLVATAARWRPQEAWDDDDLYEEEIEEDDPDVVAGMDRLAELREQGAAIPELRPRDTPNA